MTVAELIAELQKLPPAAEVWHDCGEWGENPVDESPKLVTVAKPLHFEYRLARWVEGRLVCMMSEQTKTL